MTDENIFVMAPIMPTNEGEKILLKSLNNLNLNYNYDINDPLSFNEENTNKFCCYWKRKVKQKINKGYTKFIGFSFGAVLLMKIIAEINNEKLKLALISMPYSINYELELNLQKVLNLCLSGEVEKALVYLYTKVYAPNKMPNKKVDILKKNLIQSRFTNGFKCLFELNKINIPNTFSINPIHLIGEKSELVNKNTIKSIKEIKQVEISNSGMRLLEDNIESCKLELQDFFI